MTDNEDEAAKWTLTLDSNQPMLMQLCCLSPLSLARVLRGAPVSR